MCFVNVVSHYKFQHTAARRRLEPDKKPDDNPDGFNTQPPEGGWVKNGMPFNPYKVSTHSRPKAAGLLGLGVSFVSYVSTHSRPKAAGRTA